MEHVYRVQLERQADDVANDHAINVKGLWGAAIGHGLTSESAAGKYVSYFVGYAVRSSVLGRPSMTLRGAR